MFLVQFKSASRDVLRSDIDWIITTFSEDVLTTLSMSNHIAVLTLHAPSQPEQRVANGTLPLVIQRKHFDSKLVVKNCVNFWDCISLGSSFQVFLQLNLKLNCSGGGCKLLMIKGQDFIISIFVLSKNLSNTDVDISHNEVRRHLRVVTDHEFYALVFSLVNMQFHLLIVPNRILCCLLILSGKITLSDRYFEYYLDIFFIAYSRLFLIIHLNNEIRPNLTHSSQSCTCKVSCRLEGQKHSTNKHFYAK